MIMKACCFCLAAKKVHFFRTIVNIQAFFISSYMKKFLGS